MTRALRDSAGWWALLLAGTALTQPLNLAETTVWHTLDTETGPVLAVLIILAGSMSLAIAAGAFLGRIRLPGKMTYFFAGLPGRGLVSRWIKAGRWCSGGVVRPGWAVPAAW